MAQEIYHRSEWGNPNEQWGNVYLNADLTNELYKRASEYENSWVTDQLLNGVGIKPSIILTPTAYEDGILNSVKPAKTFGSEQITNGDFSNGSTDWFNPDNAATFSNNSVTITGGSGNRRINQANVTSPTSSQWKLQYEITEKVGTSDLKVYTTNSGSAAYEVVPSTIGVHTYFFNTNNTTFYFNFSNSTGSITIDNVSVKEVIDADFDFTRGSSATRVNEKGLIQDVQILSDELVQNGNFEQIGPEEVTNGGFDENTNGWVDYLSTSSWDNGSIKSTVTTNAAYIRQNSIVTANKFYKVTFKAKSTNISQNIRIFNGTTFVDTSLSFDEVNTYKDFTYYLYTTVSQIIIGQTGLSVGDAVNFDNVSVKEVGQNWSFGTGWSIEDGVVEANNTSSFISQSGLIQASKLYRLTFEARLKSGTNGNINAYIGGSNNQQFTIDSTNWQSFTYVNTRGGSTSNSIYFNNNGTELELDNISVIEITDDTDLPRINYTNFDYENGEVVPYSGEGSLLLEPQSTNLVTYSEDFSNSSWIKNSTGTGTNPTLDFGYISPDGSVNATKITFNIGAGSLAADLCFVKTNISAINGVATIYLKGNTGGEDISFLAGNTRENIILTNSWKRYTLSNTSLSQLVLRLRGDQSTNKSCTIYVWGAQVEEQSYATSYIPTEGSTKTRLADICNNAGSSDLINSTEGVLYCEVATLVDPTGIMVIGLSDGTDVNRISITFHSTLNRIQVFSQKNSSQLFNIDTTSVSKTNFNKVAISYSSTSAKLFVNGTLVASATPSDMFVANTLDRVNFDVGSGAYKFEGKVKTVAVFKEALSDTELQKLTTI